ncbi:hypothetical protein [Actinoplanes sp. NPDC049265]|uniref:hypothetical protein n=1 Tax=Actinoplanes sp. NPDC049265 TaxID=3363902 RepID=UPI003720F2B7
MRERARPVLRSTALLFAVATIAAAASVLAGPRALAIPGGIALGCLLPGLALNALIFRYRALSAVERTVLVPGLSLATMIVAGLVLYVAGFKLDRVSWSLATAGITLAMLALRAVPERVWQGEEEDDEEGPKTELIPRITDETATPLPGPFAPRSPEQRVERRTVVKQLLPMLLVLAVVGGAGWLSYTSSQDSYRVTVTTLYSDLPGPVGSDGGWDVDIRATGLVEADGPYSVVVTDPTGNRIIERRVAGGDGTWGATLRLPSASRMTIGLYRAGDTAAYRTVIVAAAQS